MNKLNDQTKQHHTELTPVRWTKQQSEALRKIAFNHKKKPAVFIREFMLEHLPELSAQPTDERL